MGKPVSKAVLVLLAQEIKEEDNAYDKVILEKLMSQIIDMYTSKQNREALASQSRGKQVERRIKHE